MHEGYIRRMVKWSKVLKFRHLPLTAFQLAMFGFWYVSLFPGRLGYDYALLARMVQKGESTSWWGANFFWLFKFLTFNGSEIFLMSFLGLLTLTIGLKYFLDSLNIGEAYKKRLLSVVMATPLYGVYGVNVSHDVFQSSGILILTAVLVRIKINRNIPNRNMLLVCLVGAFSLVTTQTGVVITSLFCVILFCLRYRVKAGITFIFLIATVLFSNLGIDSNNRMSHLAGEMIPRLLLADLKCIAQHPEAEISTSEWQVLERYSSRDNWTKPVTCSNPDALIAPLKLENKELILSKDLVRTFIKVASRSPAIPVMSHIQRSSVALPPPFFQPPPNQVSWDVSKPIGLGTNVALQQGSGLLHPSVDEPSVRRHINFLKPLEALAQAPTLLVNQASWFWGWGGLWLWPIGVYFWRRTDISRIRDLVLVASPTITLHILLFVVGPSSLGRYVMSTVLQGFICTILLCTPRVSKK